MQKDSFMITPTCSRCGSELTEFGALLFGPPENDGKVAKIHLCRACYEEVIRMIKG